MRLVPRLALAAAAALLAGACSDATAPARSTDLPTALAELSLGNVLPPSMSVGAQLPALSPSASCPYDAARQLFACAPVTVNGVTVTQGYTLLTASGTPQAAFDAASTAAIRSDMTAAGLRRDATDSLAIDARQSLTLSGLLTGRHVLDGTQNAHLKGTSAGVPLDETMVTTIAGLLPPANGARYPGGGTVTTTITDASTSSGSFTVIMTIVFNGTSKVDVTISGGSFSTHCIVDLANPGSAGTACTG